MMLADITAATPLGDAPTLRQAFRALVDYPNEERITAGSPGLLLVAFNKVCQALTADHAVMPGALCGLLDMPADSTFAHGAMVAVQRHHAAIMLHDRARPAYALNGVAQPALTIHREWVSAAILSAVGVESFELTMADHPMPSNGHIGVMGTVTYV